MLPEGKYRFGGGSCTAAAAKRARTEGSSGWGVGAAGPPARRSDGRMTGLLMIRSRARTEGNHPVTPRFLTESMVGARRFALPLRANAEVGDFRDSGISVRKHKAGTIAFRYF